MANSFVFAKIRGKDVYKVYENTEERKYVGVIEAAGAEVLDIADALEAGTKEKTMTDGGKLEQYDEKTRFVSGYDTKLVAKELKAYIKAVDDVKNPK